jgi:polysaccharide biosynthesis transport protein
MTSTIHTGEGSTLRHYLTILNRRRWWIVFALVAVPLFALLFSTSRSALYEAQADVLLSRQNLAASLTGAVDPTIYIDETRFAETQAELASVPVVAERTLDELGLDMNPAELLATSSVAAAPNVDLLEFKVQHGDPDLAVRIADEYAEQYTLYRTEIDTAATRRALSAVRQRLVELRADGVPQSSAVLQGLLQNEQQLETMDALQTTSAFVVRQASAEQVRPRPVRDATLGVFLGLALGLALALLAEALDTRIRTVDELSERLGLPLIGTVPPLQRRMRRPTALGMLAEPESAFAEAFRMLRTNVDFANLDRHAKVVMITSSVEGEGKSTTASNLAVAYARTGRSVLLVDFDLRRPTIHTLFNLPQRPGVTDVALGYATFEQALTPIPLLARGPRTTAGTQEGKLQVLRSGLVPPDAGEFLASSAVDAMLSQLRARDALVLLDAPPLLQVGDAMTMTANVDAILLVARRKVVKRSMMRETRRLLDVAPADKLGLVVTDVAGEGGYGYASYGTEPSRRRWRIRLSARPRPRTRRLRRRTPVPEAASPQEARPPERAIPASRRR